MSSSIFALTFLFFGVVFSETLQVHIDPLSTVGTIDPFLFGNNNNDNDNGFGIVYQGAELITDRSFRSYNASLAVNYWIVVPPGKTQSIIRVLTGGDTNPDGSPFYYPGYMHFVSPANASSNPMIIAQALTAPLRENIPIELHFSVQTATEAIILFDIQDATGNSTINGIQTIIVQGSSGWQRINQTNLVPIRPAPGAVFLMAVTSPGTAVNVSVDEVRLFVSTPTGRGIVDTAAKDAITKLGIKSVRWPGGNVDTFSWNVTVGTILNRGEHQIGNGFQTPSYGLDEFLSLAEELQLIPILTTDMFDSPSSLELEIQYITGNASTPGGAKRAQNGRQDPYNLTWIELGNEPNLFYDNSNNFTKASISYKNLAINAANAIRAANPLLLLGAIVDYQLDSEWNKVLFSEPSLTQYVNFTDIHFYSYQWLPKTSFSDTYYGILSGGTYLTEYWKPNYLSILNADLPFVTTEYNSVLIDPTNYGLDRDFLKTFATGLESGDELLMQIKAGFKGAHIFDLAENGPGTFIQPTGSAPSVWTIAPSGLAFQLLSAFCNETQISADFEGSVPEYTFPQQITFYPNGFSYSLLSVISSIQGNGFPRIAVINRDFFNDYSIQFNVTGLDLTASYELNIVEYYNVNVNATNIDNPTNVALTYSSLNVTADSFVLDVKAHSIIRIDVVGTNATSTTTTTTTTGHSASHGFKLMAPVSIITLLVLLFF